MLTLLRRRKSAYDETLRLNVTIYLNQDFGRQQQTSAIRFEGDDDVAVAKLFASPENTKGNGTNFR
ncbi:MAG: hypothetical protein ABJO54_10680 [Hyphomicrobiales bacterium]